MLSLINRIILDHRFKAFANLSAALLLFCTLISYNHDDPSFNTVSGEQPANLLGFFGAKIADFLLQIFGLSIYLLPVIFVLWGLVLLYKGTIKWWPLRAVSLFFSLVLFSATLSFINYKFLPSGFGGYVGWLFKDVISDFDFIGTIIALTSALALFGWAIGISKDNAKSIINMASKEKLSSALYNRNVTVTEGSSATRKAPKIKSDEPSVANNEIEELHLSTTPVNTRHETSGLYELPTIDLLGKYNNQLVEPQSDEALREKAEDLLGVLRDFGVKGEVVGISQGPVVTMYELEPSAGTKSSRVIGLSDDIARSLSAISTRIAVIPGRNALGVELPNDKREFFSLRDLIETHEYRNPSFSLPIILGKDLGGKPAVVDLAKMPHLLVAGTTGSGKSVAINAMIISLLYRHTPESCKFIMIDPKMLELSVYDGIPHLLTPVVTEPGKAVVALKWAVKEMENRYRLMSNLGVRNIAGYNEKISHAAQKGEQLERTVQTGFDPDTGKPIYESVPIAMEKLPFIVVIVDEMADLMLVAGKDIESSIQRLAQMARAAGIHLIMATQRPSVDVITGVIKANFPSRISFKVTSKIDSRTILGEQGAEQLLGMGDMLYMGSNSKIARFHGPFVDDREVENITQFLKAQGTPEYINEVTTDPEADDFELDVDGEGDDDSLYRQAVAIIKRDKKVSTSYVQRCLRIGYNRAALIIERMESEGVVSPPNHSGKREILVSDA